MAKIQSPSTMNPTVIVPVDPSIENYMRGLANHTDHPALIEMEALARQNNFPIVERLVGIFLESLAKMVNAKRVFEFGSGYGYSAYWFARAVGQDGCVVCTDGDCLNRDKAEQFLLSANLWGNVEFHVGIAQDIFRQTNEMFDICYNDVDKGDYPAVWQMAKDRIRPGGLYIADNVLWHSRVATNSFIDVVPGWTEAIMEHNQLIFNDPAFDTFLNPTRDGVIVARRKTV